MANQRKLVVRLTDLGGRCRVRQAQNAVEGTGVRYAKDMQDQQNRERSERSEWSSENR